MTERAIDLASSEQPTDVGVVAVSVTPYDPSRDREGARRNLAYWLLGLLTLTLLGLVLAVILGATNLDQLVALLLTPIVGLVGTVLGFYFGGEKK